MADRVEASIERFAPGFRALLVETARRSPRRTSSARSGSPAATSSRASACREFMWDRRLPYRTGAEGVYLCGAGTHPGGSVIAVNGRNAAHGRAPRLG